MDKKIALQLYSLREQLKDDFAGVIKKIADMGYAGVEPAGFPGSNIEEASRIFKDLGLKVCSVHTGIPVGNDKNKIIDSMHVLRSKKIISGKGPDEFSSIDKIKQTCDIFNLAAENAKENSMSFGVHNHWWEFQEVEGKFVYEHMLEYLVPDVLFEIDTYWVKTAGRDPVQVIEQLGQRVFLLHIKDGPCRQEEAMVAVGTGAMDFPPVVEAAGQAEWLIVELDRCDTDMIEAVQSSITHLIEKGLGHGRQLCKGGGPS